MNRNVFLTDLGKLLSFMTEEERARTLRDYERKLEAAGPNGEQVLLAEYGSATKVAVEIFRAYKLGEPVFALDEAEAEAEIAPEGEAEAGFEAEAAAEVEAAVETDAEIEVEALLEAMAETKPLFAAEPAVEAEPEAEPEIEAAVEPMPEAEIVPVVELEAEAEIAPVVEVKAEAEAEIAPVVERKAEPEPEREPVFVELAPPPEFLIPKAAPEPDTELAEYRIPGWAVALVMVFTCWLWIPLIVVQYVLAIVLFAVFLALALGCFAACGGLVISAIWAFDKIPDALLIFGAAAILLAIGLVLLWFAIWLLIVLLRLITAGIRGTYRGIFRRKTGKERAR